ncbi:GNAT family N-acetyltransferase [Luteimonas sp. A649]
MLAALESDVSLIEIRSAILADADQISACLAELGYGTPVQLVEQRISEFAGSTSDKIFIAHRSGSLAALGVASAHAIPLFHTQGQLVRLTALAVSRASQGLGVGRTLVAAVEDWAWSTGARRVEVTSGDHRPAAHIFYQSVGYVSDERRFIKHAPPVAASGS